MVFVIVTILTQQFKVIEIQSHFRIVDVVFININLMMNYRSARLATSFTNAEPHLFVYALCRLPPL